MTKNHGGAGFAAVDVVIYSLAMPSTGERFERAVEIMAQLRAPGGCPWDREQTFDSIKQYTLEETYEVFEAIDNRDWKELPGELGDLLLQVLFYAEMAKEDGSFSIDDVLDRLSEKLVRRHPHVFGDVKAETSGEVLRNWDALKAQEKQEKEKKERGAQEGASLLAGVSKAMPGLLEARKLSSKAAKVGFDWPDVESVLEKLQEESEELRAELKQIPAEVLKAKRGEPAERGERISSAAHERLEEEIGDIMFALVNIARFLEVDPEAALKKTNRKFRTRFAYIERALGNAGREPQDARMEELEELWQKGKQQERGRT